LHKTNSAEEPRSIALVLNETNRRRTMKANGPFLSAVVLTVYLLAFLAGRGPVDALVRETPDSLVLPSEAAVEDLLHEYVEPENGGKGGSDLTIDPSLFEALRVREYVVRPGDTLSEIAARFDLNMGTIASFNDIGDARRMMAGATYKIPNQDGQLHRVRRGESLSSISAKYGVSINRILDANDLASDTIGVGQRLFIPDVEMDDTTLAMIKGELFVYPVRGRLTDGFGHRHHPITGVWHMHNGIDIAGRIGTPIVAARSGTVVHVESQIGNYGRFVIVSHPGGFQTLYAHLDNFAVRRGQYVSTGEKIGELGNTGLSTGPHLHFSIIQRGRFINPLSQLH
jgi:murein DD-endopeptidase MepM/ murein hydrolase activator NlpD